jgi:SRSO17 transposase
VTSATKPQLAAQIIERAIAAAVPFRWVAADTVYGAGHIERDFRRAGKGYVLDVHSAHVFRSWDKPRRIAGTAANVAKTLEPSDRRNIADGDVSYFTTWCPAKTSIETLVGVEGHRWAIEDSFETAKNEFGLDHNETRSWHRWHHHVSFAMLAFATMAAVQYQANKTIPKKQRHARRKDARPRPLVDTGNPVG